MESTLFVLQIVLAIVIVILVLLQKSSSIGLGSYSGSNESVFGAKGPASFLAKATFFVAIAFIGVTLALGYTYNKEHKNSVVEKVAPTNSAPMVIDTNSSK